MTLVFYISGHGFGHASRDIEVLNALARRDPRLRLIVRTAAQRWLFDLTLLAPAEIHAVETDTGVVQIDSLHLDEAETIRRAGDFHGALDRTAEAEAAFLEQAGASLVVGDIPPLAFAAAARAGVPGIAIGNFTWDWIYEEYASSLPLAPALLETIRAAYRRARLALRLPMSGGFAAFSDVRDIPLIARRARRAGAEVRQGLGLPENRPIALLSFGGYGLEGFDLRALSCLGGWAVVTTTHVARGGNITVDSRQSSVDRNQSTVDSRQSTVAAESTVYSRKHTIDSRESMLGGEGTPPRVARSLGQGLFTIDEREMYAAGYRYEDLVAAVDVVATKPGYGIIAECIANDTAILYTSRGHFVEYDVLVAAMRRCTRSLFITNDTLYSGRLAPHLDRLLAQPAPPEHPATDGAEVAADIILGFR